jgi:N-acetyl-alpha-D-muramate 1-phosphate uridylyltransferase
MDRRKPMNSPQVAILAGGLGTRLGGRVHGQPKSMVDIHGLPFLHYQLQLLKRQGIDDVVICLGHLGEQIESHFGNGQALGVHITYSAESSQLGTAGALKNAAPLLKDKFFTLYGDSYVFVRFKDVQSFFQRKRKLGLMTVFRNQDRYDTSNTVIAGDLVSRYSKRQKTPEMACIEYGVNLFRKEILNWIPAGQPYGLEDLFPPLIKAKQLLAYPVSERFYEIGSLSGLDEFSRYIEAQRDSVACAN